jgi:hypothetical protein
MHDPETDFQELGVILSGLPENRREAFYSWLETEPEEIDDAHER